jgi:hypothetical protein
MRRFTLFVQTETMTKWLSNSGLALCLLAALLVIGNQYGSLNALVPYYRINTPALCLLAGFVAACFSMRLAIAGCVFALPLLPTVAWQLQLYTGYGRVQDVAGAGLDLIAGALLGLVVNCLWHRKSLRERVELPWPAGLVLVILTISVTIAVARNLHQTDSPFTLQALAYNLLHLRSLGWHDDFRPLLDWAAYSMAFLLVALFTPALRGMPDRNDVIFKPLIAGLVIAALVGLRQSMFGAGLNVSQLNFRLNGLGFMALGFQPDLHAFGAHMLIGVVGLFGYLQSKKNLWVRLLVLGLVLPLCAVMLFLCKSKATFAIAILCLLAIAALWLFRRAKYLRLAGLILVAVGTLFILSLVIFTDSWIGLLSFAVHKFDLPDLHTLNLKLSYRPEVYLAAIQMFALFPFAGLGQSQFYHQSANHELTQSLFLSIEQNGENAHNYFLQTLVENGLLGFFAFVLLLSYPIFRVADKRVLIPGLFALAAIFGGNVFSHSMLVRENLLLAACFVALMYSWVTAKKISSTIEGPLDLHEHHILRRALRLLTNWFKQPKVLAACGLVAFLLIAKEAHQSLQRYPFDVDVQCHVSRRIEPDGWTSGRYMWDVPVGAQGMVLNLATTQPDVTRRPLPATLTVWYDQRLLLQKDISLNKTGPQSLEVDLPKGTLATPDDYQIELKVERCFVPRNWGMGGDGRRLGVRIESVDWK